MLGAIQYGLCFGTRAIYIKNSGIEAYALSKAGFAIKRQEGLRKSQAFGNYE